MNAKYLVTIFFACAMTGCSFYDVATITTDAAFGTGLFSDGDREDADWNGLWDPDISKCIKDEKELRGVLRQLDTLEEGKDVVILPTGEKYPIEERSLSDESLPGPTATCLSRFSD